MHVTGQMNYRKVIGHVLLKTSGNYYMQAGIYFVRLQANLPRLLSDPNLWFLLYK